MPHQDILVEQIIRLLNSVSEELKSPTREPTAKERRAKAGIAVLRTPHEIHEATRHLQHAKRRLEMALEALGPTPVRLSPPLSRADVERVERWRETYEAEHLTPSAEIISLDPSGGDGGFS
jgi:hypothetical protein